MINQETLTQVHQYLNTPIIKRLPDLEEEKATPNRVWQVVPTAKQPQAPAWLIGTLVHEAIALWRFPDKGFDKWVKARAGSLRFNKPSAQLANAVREVGRLLARFKDWD